MLELTDQQILVVDTYAAHGPLCDLLKTRGARVHVFDSAQNAIAMAEQNKLDGAFIQFDDDVPTKELCARLRERNVPVIFTASDTARAAGYLLQLVSPSILRLLPRAGCSPRLG